MRSERGAGKISPMNRCRKWLGFEARAHVGGNVGDDENGGRWCVGRGVILTIMENDSAEKVMFE